MDVKLTPTEQRIYDLLSDGMPKPRAKVFECLDDELTAVDTLYVHVFNLRKKLRHLGRDVVSRKGHSGATYQLVQTIDRSE